CLPLPTAETETESTTVVLAYLFEQVDIILLGIIVRLSNEAILYGYKARLQPRSSAQKQRKTMRQPAISNNSDNVSEVQVR
ncbi:MAG: hypothetical protein ACXWAT_14140, partial [Methylobacter sp.]